MSSLLFYLNMLGVYSFLRPQFQEQTGVGHDSQLCINLPVGSPFAAMYVAHIERLHVAFSVAYDSASQSTFLCSLFFNVPIFPSVAARRGGGIYHLFCGYYQLCGYFPSILMFFFLISLKYLLRVSTFCPVYLSLVAPNLLRVDHTSILFSLYDHILR